MFCIQNTFSRFSGGFLTVKTFPEFPDEQQAYYARVTEGIITIPILQGDLENTYTDNVNVNLYYLVFLEYCSKFTPFCLKLKQYLITNIESMIVKSRNGKNVISAIVYISKTSSFV